jgi:hypothetical protein
MLAWISKILNADFAASRQHGGHRRLQEAVEILVRGCEMKWRFRSSSGADNTHDDSWDEFLHSQ